jgi:hypothetical protein
VESAARRLQTVTRSPCFQATMRKPSCLISCSPVGPGGWAINERGFARTDEAGKHAQPQRGLEARAKIRFSMAFCPRTAPPGLALAGQERAQVTHRLLTATRSS